MRAQVGFGDQASELPRLSRLVGKVRVDYVQHLTFSVEADISIARKEN